MTRALHQEEGIPATFFIRANTGSYLQVDEKGGLCLASTQKQATTFTLSHCNPHGHSDSTSHGFYLQETTNNRLLCASGQNVYFSIHDVEQTAICNLVTTANGSCQLMIGILALSLHTDRLITTEDIHAHIAIEDATVSNHQDAAAEVTHQPRSAIQTKALSRVDHIYLKFENLLNQFILEAPAFLSAENTPLCLLIGCTGNGKSTLANLLSGNKLEMDLSGTLHVKDRSKKYAVTSAHLGHGCTQFPTIYPVEGINMAVVDTPGLLDFKSNSEILHAITMRLSLGLAKKIGPLVIVISLNGLTVSRGKLFVDLLKLLQKTIHPRHWKAAQENIHFVFNIADERKTHADLDYIRRAITPIREDYSTGCMARQAHATDVVKLLDIILESDNAHIWPSYKDETFRAHLLEKLQRTPAINSDWLSFDPCHQTDSEVLTELLSRFSQKCTRPEFIRQKAYILNVVYPTMSILRTIYTEIQHVFSSFFKACEQAYRTETEHAGTDLQRYQDKESLSLNWAGWRARLQSHDTGLLGFCHALAAQIVYDDELKHFFYQHLQADCFSGSVVNIALRLHQLLDAEAMTPINTVQAITKRFPGLCMLMVNDDKAVTASFSPNTPILACVRLVKTKNGKYHTVYAHPANIFSPISPQAYPHLLPAIPADFNESLMRFFKGAHFQIENSLQGQLTIRLNPSNASSSHPSLLKARHLSFWTDILAPVLVKHLNTVYGEHLSAELNAPSVHIKAPKQMKSALYASLWAQNMMRPNSRTPEAFAQDEKEDIKSHEETMECIVM